MSNGEYITVYEIQIGGLTERDYEGLSLVGPVPDWQSIGYLSTREQANAIAEKRRAGERRPGVSYRVVSVSDRVRVFPE